MEPHGLQGDLGGIVLRESPIQIKECVRPREKSDSLFNQSIHIQLQIESNCLSSIFLVLVNQSVAFESSQESQVGMPLSASQ